MGLAGILQESEALTAVSLNGLTRVKSPGVWWPNSKLNITMLPCWFRKRKTSRSTNAAGG